MTQLTLTLPEEAARRLEELARSEGRTPEAVVLDALESYPGFPDDDSTPRPRRKFLIRGIVEGDGRSAADIPKAELLEGFGES